MLRSLLFAHSGSKRNEDGCPRSMLKMPGNGGWPKVPPRSFATNMRAVMSDIDLDQLRAELDDFAEPEKKGGRSPREERIIAGIEEIQRFVEKQGRTPKHGENLDICGRLYAVRLE